MSRPAAGGNHTIEHGTNQRNIKYFNKIWLQYPGLAADCRPSARDTGYIEEWIAVKEYRLSKI